MQLINSIFTQNSTPAFTSTSLTSTQSDNIYTLENLIQTLEEAANCLAVVSQQQIQAG
ncbi:MAG: hypothetical protein RLZZ507_623 [Cyanobacteriota bacterium]|jgi:hypothetical protein